MTNVLHPKSSLRIRSSLPRVTIGSIKHITFCIRSVFPSKIARFLFFSSKQRNTFFPFRGKIKLGVFCTGGATGLCEDAEILACTLFDCGAILVFLADELAVCTAPLTDVNISKVKVLKSQPEKKFIISIMPFDIKIAFLFLNPTSPHSSCSLLNISLAISFTESLFIFKLISEIF